uniref:Uncharacterized protein n=1 Tax=Globodera rostochiensis TaxID=31243 RepID=A0A914GQ48_GLORO
MNKWDATSLVLLIAILCGAIHGAVLREQQQPLDAEHQQAPGHSNGTERTDTDNAEPEKPGPNPEMSEPEKPGPNPETSELEKPGPNPETSELEKPGPNPETSELEKPGPNPETSELEKPGSNPKTSELEKPGPNPETYELEKPGPNPETSELEKPGPNPETSELEKPGSNPETSELEKPGPNPETSELEKPGPNPETSELEKPGPNTEKSEPDESELYPEEAEPDESELYPAEAEPEKPVPNPEKSEAENLELNPEKSEPEKPGPNPEKSEPDQSEQYPAEAESEKPVPDPEKSEPEKPVSNPEKSEPDQSELYPAEAEPDQSELNPAEAESEESEGEQARKKRQAKPVNSTTTAKPNEPKANTSKPVNIGTNSTGPTPPSNTTAGGPPNPPANNKTDGTSNYEPKDNPDIKRNYTAKLVYWHDEGKTCHRKAEADAKENPKMDKVLALGQISVINKTAVKGAAPKTDSGNDVYFNKWSECAKIQFYGELGLEDAQRYFGNGTAAPKEEFSNMREFEKAGFMQDMVLLLIDGRVVCTGAKEEDPMTVTLSIVQNLKEGLISSVCPAKEKHEYGKTNLTMTESSTFVLGVVLRERLCPHNKVPGQVPNVTGDLVIEKLKYKYENVSLLVKHSCMGKNETVNIALPPIDVFETNELDRVLQLRDLELNLTTLMNGAMLEMGSKTADVSGFYFPASVVVGSGTAKNNATDANSEEKMHVEEGEIIAVESDVE